MRSKTHTPGGFLWTSGQLIADATTYTTYRSTSIEHPCPQQNLNPRSQRSSFCRPFVLLRPHCHRDRQAYINTQLKWSCLKDKSRISRLWLYSPYVTVAKNCGLIVLCLKLLWYEPPNSYTRLFVNIRLFCAILGTSSS